MTAEYELKAERGFNDYSGSYEENYSRCKKEFDAYCILNRKVKF